MVLWPASLLRRHRMGVVEADQTFAVRAVQGRLRIWVVIAT